MHSNTPQRFLLNILYLVSTSTTAAIADTVSVQYAFDNPQDLPFQHMVVDRQYTSRVYLGAVNRLYQLSPDLQLQASVETGPQEDTPNCPASGECPLTQNTAKQLLNNYNKALAIFYRQSKLVACGSLYQGSCSLRNLYNISVAESEVREAVVANDKDSSSVVFVAPGPPDPAKDEVLYVGSTFTDLGSYRDDVAAVASKSLDRENLFKVAQRAINSETQIFVERSKRRFYKIEYVYGFASGNFSYFVTRQPKLATGSSPYISKLVRLCQRDRNYYSYTEVPIECSSTEGVAYNLVQDAYVGKPGYDLAESLAITPDDDVLFAVFARGDGDSNQPTSESALCVYSLRAVEAVFLENIMMCAKGEANRGLDFYKKSTACQKTRFPPGFDVACGNEVNYPLGGELPVSQTPVVTTADSVFTAVAASTIHGFTVAFIGTSNGILRKVVVESAKTGFAYQDTSVTNGARILQDLSLDMSGEFLYVLTEQSVLKVKVQACMQYQRCGDCLNARDPYCGWCSLQNKCSVKDQCEASAGQLVAWLPYKDQQCTTISKVTPDQIQITSSEYLSLTIQNLPSVSGQLTCVFALLNRKLSTGASRSDNTITCPTPPTDQLPQIPSGQNHIDSILSVQTGNGPDFAATNFTFYDCATHTSCSQCVSSRFPCDWCVESNQCTPAQTTEDRCRTQHIINGMERHGPTTRKGAKWCPSFDAAESDIIVPSGMQKQITVQTHNILDFQTSFTCQFAIGTANVLKAPAKRNADGSLQCNAIDFRYFDATPNMTAKFSVLWESGKSLDNPKDIKVIIYKCARLSSNCGMCLNVDEVFACGWCTSKSECAIKQDCAQPSDKWLERSETCPGPKITSFSPTSGPLEGGTRLTVEGINLGKTFADIVTAVKINNVPCVPIPELYLETRRIVCEVGPATHHKVQSGPVVVAVRNDAGFTALSDSNFYYVDPMITGFSPSTGPQAGGTVVTIFGQNMDAGSNVTVKVAGVSCSEIWARNSTSLKCRTGPSLAAVPGGIEMQIDQAFRKKGDTQFVYASDPGITDVTPDKSIVSGGLRLTVRGDRFNLIQSPRMYILFNGQEFTGNCSIQSSGQMFCLTPPLPLSPDDLHSPTAERPLPVEYGFALDGVTTTRNMSSKAGFKHLHVYPDPEFEQFPILESSGRRVKYFKNDYLTINGRYIDLAATESDVRIFVGSGRCNLTVMAGRALTCRPPILQPLPAKSSSDPAGSLPEVVVFVGSRNYSIGYLSYNEGLLALIPLETIIAIAVACGIFILAIIIVMIAYRRKSTRHLRQMKSLKEQIDAIEMKVASECKEAFAELQTDMTELTADMAIGIPILSYREYVARVLFPNTIEPPALRDLEVESHRKAHVEKSLTMLNALLCNKTFLLALVRTLESNKYFLSKDRVYFGSLLMVIFQEKMEYCTEILKTLLAELIEKAVDRPSQPKILFRRSESIAERMLAAWYTFLMYRYLVECAGQPLFYLYCAIKQQVEKGPQDAITYEARYSLSEEKLFRQSIGFTPMMIFVGGLTGCTDIAVRVLDCDTITQVKEKCLDCIYKTTPYSRRPSSNDLDLEWRTGVSGRLVLQDIDMTTKTEQGDWRRLNTLAHYKVPNNASLALVPRQASMFNLSILSEKSDKSQKSFSTFSLKNSPTLTRTLPSHKKYDGESGPRLFHLIKPNDHESAANDRGGGKMVSEIYLTRLLTAKGTLQKYIEDFYETIFSTAHRGTPLPICIKYMFDFMDDQAIYHGITDPDVPHTWKSNSLPLRFWVNLIKNPNFFFDIAKPAKIEGCLSVVAQTLMDSCSTKDHPLTKDSPSSKLLFAKDIPNYRDWVDRYYSDIKLMPCISDQDMNAFLSDESRQHQNDFNIYSALYELYKYILQYRDQFHQSLEEDEFCRKNKLGSRLTHMFNMMEGSNTV